MPEFPTKEADIAALAGCMVAGYKAHEADFPSISWGKLSLRFFRYKLYRNKQIEKTSAAQLATAAKNSKLSELTELMKKYLKKSEVDVSGDPVKLSFIGWGMKAALGPAAAPGQPTNLRIIAQAATSVLLSFERPACGSIVRNYIIEQRLLPDENAEPGPWHIAATCLNNKVELINQPRGIQTEFRVKAANVSGESMPSNTVAAIL
jgi:hypothetical protein